MTVIFNVKQTIATLKGIEAQLSILALNSQEEKAQSTFHNMMLLIEEVKNDLHNRQVEMELEEPQYKQSLIGGEKYVRLDTHIYSFNYFYCCINRYDKNPRKKANIGRYFFFEYVSGITIGSIAGEVIMGLDNNIGHGVLAIAVFSSITLLVDILGLKSKRFRDLVDGTSTILIKDGKIMEDNLKKEKYSIVTKY